VKIRILIEKFVNGLLYTYIRYILTCCEGEIVCREIYFNVFFIWFYAGVGVPPDTYPINSVRWEHPDSKMKATLRRMAFIIY